MTREFIVEPRHNSYFLGAYGILEEFTEELGVAGKLKSVDQIDPGPFLTKEFELYSIDIVRMEKAEYGN